MHPMMVVRQFWHRVMSYYCSISKMYPVSIYISIRVNLVGLFVLLFSPPRFHKGYTMTIKEPEGFLSIKRH